MTDKERYHEFCKKEINIPVFSQDWWMDIVCGADHWNVYLVGKGNDIKASFVYSVDWEAKAITRAMVTQNNGIWMVYPKGQGTAARQKYEEKIINEICDYIESLGLTRYEQQFHYSFTNWLPFFWRRFKETTRYTYVIEDTGDYGKIREHYSSKIKNELRKAEKFLSVEITEDLEEFYMINRMSFERQEIEIPYSFEFFRNLYLGCQTHKAGLLIKAVDQDRNVHSVAMLVWDHNSVYYLLNGTNPELKMYQGNLLLIDYGIRLAHEKHKMFDFEGSVIKNVNHAFREFGGNLKPYFRICKDFDRTGSKL